MSGACFYYHGKRYDVSDADWLEGVKSCQSQRRCGDECKSCSGLVVHCCKHVVYGTEHEQERYRNVADKLEFDSAIPSAVRTERDAVVRNYRALSRKVLQYTQAISLTGEGKSFRVACEGHTDTEGLTDYLTFQKNEYRGNTVLGVVSSFFNFSTPETFSMLRLIKQKYFEHQRKGRGVSCVPAASGADFQKQLAYHVPAADYAFSEANTYWPAGDDTGCARAVFFRFLYHKRRDALQSFYWDLWDEEAYYNAAFYEKDRMQDCIAAALQDERSAAYDEAYRQLTHYQNVYSAWIAYLSLGRFLAKGNPVSSLPNDEPVWSLTPFLQNHQKPEPREVFLQLVFLKRMQNTIIKRFSDRHKEIWKELEDNEKRDASIGSTADYSAFTLVSAFAISLVAASELRLTFDRVFDKRSKTYGDWYRKHKKALRALLRTTLEAYTEFRNECSGKCASKRLAEWWEIFERIFDLEAKRKVLAQALEHM